LPIRAQKISQDEEFSADATTTTLKSRLQRASD
jgi:hypothetical protein